jgi:NAD(P)-dependent dehydrogenase (short-subunit alcohol dehydrogenase family)
MGMSDRRFVLVTGTSSGIGAGRCAVAARARVDRLRRRQAPRAHRARAVQGFADRGLLAPSETPAREIMAFLETDGHPAFAERRLGRT